MRPQQHFVIMPFPAFGHIIPMLELGKKIQQRDNKVTLVISDMKLSAIKERNLLPVDMDVVTLKDGLSDDYDKDLEPKQFKAGLKAMYPTQKELIENIPIGKEMTPGPITTNVDGIIFDIMFSAISPVIHERNIGGYAFSCAAAWTITGSLFVDENTPTTSDDAFFKADDEVSLDHMEKGGRNGIQESFKDLCLMLTSAFPLVKAVVINSFEDLEPHLKTAFESHPKSAGTPMKFVGPLIPTNDPPNAVTESVQNWLDKQPERSVVYVSFGSMAIPLPEQIKELAEALTELNKPFIWSLRTSQHHHLPEWFREKMADGYEGQFLVLPWAPQKAILAHKATRAFLSHCGWNSTLEGLSNGVPCVAWPMFADQYLNADFLVKIGTAYKVPHTSVKATRVVPKSEILHALESVINREESNKENSFEERASYYGQKALETIADGGKSSKDLAELF